MEGGWLKRCAAHFTPRKEFRYQLTRGRGPRASLDILENRKCLSSTRIRKPRDRTSRSWILYCLRYTGSYFEQLNTILLHTSVELNNYYIPKTFEPWRNNSTVETCSMKRMEEHFTAVKFYDKLMIKSTAVRGRRSQHSLQLHAQ